ncbi:MAG: hypothetical protein CO068_06810 [Flavobacteriaceae bacterium CG_4_9_14_0_8_um_filter_34_30]|nr:MAG: hypothetical protein CO068_06810 [Flavobacteriaceae bacterium CG_4_9_14_0_8_um_filter_34_30]
MARIKRIYLQNALTAESWYRFEKLLSNITQTGRKGKSRTESFFVYSGTGSDQIKGENQCGGE